MLSQSSSVPPLDQSLGFLGTGYTTNTLDMGLPTNNISSASMPTNGYSSSSNIGVIGSGHSNTNTMVTNQVNASTGRGSGTIGQGWGVGVGMGVSGVGVGDTGIPSYDSLNSSSSHGLPSAVMGGLSPKLSSVVPPQLVSTASTTSGQTSGSLGTYSLFADTPFSDHLGGYGSVGVGGVGDALSSLTSSWGATSSSAMVMDDPITGALGSSSMAPSSQGSMSTTNTTSSTDRLDYTSSSFLTSSSLNVSLSSPLGFTGIGPLGSQSLTTSSLASDVLGLSSGLTGVPGLGNSSLDSSLGSTGLGSLGMGVGVGVSGGVGSLSGSLGSGLGGLSSLSSSLGPSGLGGSSAYPLFRSSLDSSLSNDPNLSSQLNTSINPYLGITPDHRTDLSSATSSSTSSSSTNVVGRSTTSSPFNFSSTDYTSTAHLSSAYSGYDTPATPSSSSSSSSSSSTSQADSKPFMPSSSIAGLTPQQLQQQGLRPQAPQFDPSFMRNTLPSPMGLVKGGASLGGSVPNMSPPGLGSSNQSMSSGPLPSPNQMNNQMGGNPMGGYQSSLTGDLGLGMGMPSGLGVGGGMYPPQGGMMPPPHPHHMPPMHSMVGLPPMMMGNPGMMGTPMGGGMSGGISDLQRLQMHKLQTMRSMSGGMPGPMPPPPMTGAMSGGMPNGPNTMMGQFPVPPQGPTMNRPGNPNWQG